MADTTGLLSQFYLKLSGSDAPEELLRDLLSVRVETSLHLPDVATVVLHDPRLAWIDDARLAPGKLLAISARSGRDEKPLFDGEIVELEPEFEPATVRLAIRAFNRMHRLGRGQHARSFQNVTDGDLVTKLAQEVGLQAQVGTTSQVYPYIFQNNESDLAFLQRRASALGYLLFVRGTTLHCEPPTKDGSPIELEWGVHLSEFRPRMTTLGQVESVTARGWDPSSGQAIVGRAQRGRAGPSVGEAQSGGELANAAFNVDAQGLVADRPIRSQAEADRLAQTNVDVLSGRFIEADGVCAGDPALVAGASIHVSAVGQRFGGTYIVTASTHSYTAEHGYSTEFSVSGLEPATLLSTLAAGTQAPSDIQASSRRQVGLVIGVVTDNGDPEALGRVKVKFPWLTSDHASDWARVVAVGAGSERGIEFLPEVNDEVLVGFELGDIRFPYVLGGLWSGQAVPPKSTGDAVSSGQVQLRVIRSRAGHVITLDDTDGGGGISIVDKSGNKIVIDSGSDKVTISTQGDVEVTAQGSMSLAAQGNLKLHAQGQVELSGTGVTVDGGASTVDVKGVLIRLN